MRDVELYRAILGLPAPWTVRSVDLDVKGQQVVVQVEAGPGPFPCPECGTCQASPKFTQSGDIYFYASAGTVSAGFPPFSARGEDGPAA
jgi:hypothetical protein